MASPRGPKTQRNRCRIIRPRNKRASLRKAGNQGAAADPGDPATVTAAAVDKIVIVEAKEATAEAKEAIAEAREATADVREATVAAKAAKAPVVLSRNRFH